MDRQFSGRTGKPALVSSDGVMFRHVPGHHLFSPDARDYRFDDIRRSDIVIDIGANAGAFCIRAARLSDRVFAVEPVTVDDLVENIRLNHADVRVLAGALGDGSTKAIEWDGMTVAAKTYPFREIRAMAGGCDFLKCDCEGGEWTVIPDELDGVRRIEMELHMPPIGGPVNRALLEYISRNYRFEIDRIPCHLELGLFGFLHAERLPLS